ncbi:MAG TPA: MBL fold metallo-hydrolase [Actinomycetota bacterium]|nr:MBL fold metallo-hydrolase [Actinomycetota bacterium]
MSARAGETPHPPETAEFGFVTPGGATHEYPVAGGVQVKKLSVGPFDNNVYVVRADGSDDALIVDGASDAERILREVEGLRVVGVVETHGHADHVQALPDLVAALDVPVFAHTGDAKRMPVSTKPLRDGQTIVVGGAEIQVLHTPGHTPGSVSLVAGPFLFSGDTLFPAGPGGTDGNTARFRQVMQSVDRLFELPDNTRICPGHGLDSTIGRERPYVETWRARGW